MCFLAAATHHIIARKRIGTSSWSLNSTRGGGGTPAPPMNVVNAGATVFKRSRPLRGGGEGSLTLTAVGRSLLERLASQSAA